ncbi:hypothetical protein [Actinoplanes sp. URMC 104]|uniref:hypothetical protein n=1 Tax=Actinoplanes sp. URMC 104 TaxID=3423409 RepID=UPI003F1B107C
MTYFTKYFTEVVGEGIASEPSTLRLNPIYLEVHARLVSDGKPAPTRRASDTADEFPFARNVSTVARVTGPDRINLESSLAAKEKELEDARLERRQLAEQLAELRMLLDATRQRRTVSSDNALADVEQQAGTLAEELHQAERRVHQDELLVEEMSRAVAGETSAMPHQEPRPTREWIRRNAARFAVAALGVAVLIVTVILIANKQFDRGNATKSGDVPVNLPSRDQSGRAAPSSANDGISATGVSSGETAYLHEPSVLYMASAPWRLQVTGSSCSVYLLNDNNEEVGSVYSRSEKSTTHWLQVRQTGLFRYQVSKQFDCKARVVPGASVASLPARIIRSASDSLEIKVVGKIHVVATPVEDQCDVTVRDSSTGNPLKFKIGLPGEVLKFDADTGGKKLYVSAGVSNCTVSVSGIAT